MDIERQVQDLTKRVAVLEAALRVSAAQIPAPQTLAPPTLAPPVPGVAPGPAPVPLGPPLGPPTVPSAPERPPSAFEWGIESVLRWAGVALVSMAAIFLVSTAVNRGWIGPELQLLGAAAGGALSLGMAVRWAETRRPWALALGCGGAVVVIASALATHEWLNLVGPGPAVVLATLAVLGSVAVAEKTRLEGIALVAGVVGLVAPFDTFEHFGTGAILGWTVAFIVGASALGLRNCWPGLRIITSWIGALVLMVYAQSEDPEGLLRIMGFIGAALIGTTLWCASSIAERIGNDEAPALGSGRWGSFDWTPVDYRLVALVPAWVTVVVTGLLSLDENTHVGLVAMLTAAGFLGLTEVTFGRVNRLVSLTTLLGSFALLAVGLAISFDGPVLMVALMGQAVTSYVLSRKLDDLPLLVGSYLAAAASSILAGATLLISLEESGFDNVGQGLATALVVLTWAGAALAVHRGLGHEHGRKTPFEIPFVGAWIGLMLWFATALTGAPQGLVLISVAWSIMACVGLIVGLTSRIASIKNMALATLALTLGKLVTVDLAEVDVFWRVGLFFVIGMGLIALGLKVPSLVGPANTLADAAHRTDPGTTSAVAEPPGDDSVTTF